MHLDNLKKAPFYIWPLFMILLTSCASSKARIVDQSTLHQTSFADLERLNRSEARHTVVFLHANWCKFCKNMEQTTFGNDDVIKTLNKNFYYISFDGESQENIKFQNRTFAFKPTGKSAGTHELATALGNISGVLTYPTLVLLNSDFEITFQHSGYLSANELLTIIKAASDH